MTEYTVKEVGHQWIVYADRQSIGACANEASALKLIAEDSARPKVPYAGRRSTLIRVSKPAVDVNQRPRLSPTGCCQVPGATPRNRDALLSGSFPHLIFPSCHMGGPVVDEPS